MTEDSQAPANGLDWSAALERLRGAYADKTMKQYRIDITVFVAWCRQMGLTPLPASAATLAKFTQDEFTRCNFRTIKRRLMVIRRVHQLLRLPDEVADPDVTLALRRGLRAGCKRPKQALGLTPRCEID